MSTYTAQPCPKIAIIGGGLGGLVLLLTLHRRGIPATLYERDVDFATRAHLGGSLDLGYKSGQRALRENGLEDEFKAHSRPEGEELKIYDATGTLLLHHSGEPSEEIHQTPERVRPEIDRTMLRKILLDACPASAIKWDHALTSAVALGGGKHALTFANGATATCDLLVGADGAHSRVRALVAPGVEPIYTGVNGVEISLAPSVAASAELADAVAAVGQGTMMAFQDNKMLGSQVNGDGRVRTYVFFRAPEEWAVPGPDADAARAALLDKFEGWAPWMLKIIEHADAEAIYPRALYMLPAGHRWAHNAGVTILGDAAHLMSPFAGAGANLAMLDGLELGLALTDVVGKGKGGVAGAVDAVVAEWEEKICAMAGRVAAGSMVNLEAFINVNAPTSALERFQSLMAGSERREG